MEAVRVGLVAKLARLSGYTIFIIIKLLYSFYFTFPNGVVLKLFHGIGLGVPFVKIADHADRRRMGRPNTENDLVLAQTVRTEELVSLGVLSLMEKIKRNIV